MWPWRPDNACVLWHAPGLSIRLDNLRSVLLYLVFAVLVVPALCAFGGAFVQCIDDTSLSEYWPSWYDWFLGNALGFLTLAPFILVWFNQKTLVLLRGLAVSWQAQALVVGLIASSLISSFVGAYGPFRAWMPMIAFFYVPLPFKIWAAVSFGERGATAAILIVVVITIMAAMNGSAVFESSDVEQTVRTLQLFLTVDSMTILLLGVSIDQDRSSRRESRRIGYHLMHAADEERRRIARDLHDNTGQELQAATMLLERLAALPGANAEEGQLAHEARDSWIA